MYEIEDLMHMLESYISELELPLREVGVITSDDYESIIVTANKFSGILDKGERITIQYPMLDGYTKEDIQKILSLLKHALD